MQIVMISVRLNTHQLPSAEALYRHTAGGFTFIETQRQDETTKSIARNDGAIPYVLRAYVSNELEKCREEIRRADIVIAGGAFDDLLKERIAAKKPVFRYAERPLKQGRQPLRYIPRLLKWHRQNPPGAPIYMLCASAYTAGDYSDFFLFRNRCYQWGYFPETRRYLDLEKLFANKSRTTILWCGRLLPWKHPDDAVAVARRLKKAGAVFNLQIIGSGELEGKLRSAIAAENLQDCVQLLGSMPTELVRDHMERAGIFLFTSDRYEGWGAVLNEAMNSGCAVAASHAIGSVPYLIEDGKNGLVYRSGSVDSLYEKVKWLLEHPDQQRRLGEAAYHTIADTWNAETAAERFVQLSQAILDGNPAPELFEKGPCSRAALIREDWYKG